MSHTPYFVRRCKDGFQVTGWPNLDRSLHVTGTGELAELWSHQHHGVSPNVLCPLEDHPFDPDLPNQPFMYHHKTHLQIKFQSGDKVVHEKLASLLKTEIDIFLAEGNFAAYSSSLRTDPLRDNDCAQYGYVFNAADVHQPCLLGSDKWPKSLPPGIPGDLVASIANIGAIVTGGLEDAHAKECYFRSGDICTYYKRFADQLGVKEEYRPLFRCSGITTTVYTSRNGVFHGFASHPDVNNGSGPLITVSIPIAPSDLSQVDQDHLANKLGHDMSYKFWIVLIYYPRHELEQTVALRKRVMEHSTLSGPVKDIVEDLENGIGCYETILMDKEKMLGYLRSGKISRANSSILFDGTAMAAVPPSFNPLMTTSATSHYVHSLSIKYRLSGEVQSALLYLNALQTNSDPLIFCMPKLMTGEIEGYRLERGKVDPFTIVEAICVYLSKNYGSNGRYLSSPNNKGIQRWQPSGPNLPYLASKFDEPIGWMHNGTDFRARFVTVLDAINSLHSASFRATFSDCRAAGETFFDKMVADATGLGPVGTHKLILNLAVALVVPAECCAVRRIGGDGCRRYVQWQLFDRKQEKAGVLTERDKTEFDSHNVEKSFFELHFALIAFGVFRRGTMPMFTEHLCCERGRLHEFWHYENKANDWTGRLSRAKSVHDLLYLFHREKKMNNMFNLIKRKLPVDGKRTEQWIPCILVVNEACKPRWEMMTNIVAGCAHFREVGFCDPLKLRWELDDKKTIPKWIPDGWSAVDGLPLFGFELEVDVTR